MKIPSPSKENRDQSLDRTSNTSDEDDIGNSKKSGVPKNDFSEYMWMENEEEFDNEVMKQLEEEALMEQCIEAMLEDEMDDKNSIFNIGKGLENLGIQDKAELAKNSKLNPNAAEFVPRSGTP